MGTGHRIFRITRRLSVYFTRRERLFGAWRWYRDDPRGFAFHIGPLTVDYLLHPSRLGR